VCRIDAGCRRRAGRRDNRDRRDARGAIFRDGRLQAIGAHAELVVRVDMPQ